MKAFARYLDNIQVRVGCRTVTVDGWNPASPDICLRPRNCGMTACICRRPEKTQGLGHAGFSPEKNAGVLLRKLN